MKKILSVPFTLLQHTSESLPKISFHSADLAPDNFPLPTHSMTLQKQDGVPKVSLQDASLRLSYAVQNIPAPNDAEPSPVFPNAVNDPS